MKKFATVLAATSLFALAACGGERANNNAGNGATENAAAGNESVDKPADNGSAADNGAKPVESGAAADGNGTKPAADPSDGAAAGGDKPPTDEAQ